MPDLTIDAASTALVLIDLQRGIAAGTTLPNAAADVVVRAARLAAACRARGVAVVLVHVDPGPNGVLFPRPVADQPRPPMQITPEFSEFDPALGRDPSDVVVTKHQPNAFYGTDLEIQLRRRGVRTILLGGISTNVGVEATARGAHERGFEQVFVPDVMAAREADLHEHSVRRIFPTLGRVRRLDVVLAALEPKARGPGGVPNGRRDRVVTELGVIHTEDRATLTTTAHPRPVMRRTAFLLVLSSLLVIPAVGHAQGYPGGAGGGRGGRAGRSMGGEPGVGDREQGPSSADMAKRMEEMASLGDAVHKVPDLSGTQKDSIKALEKRYGEVFKSYGIALRNQIDSARAQGGMPDMRAMGLLRLQADSVRDVELAAARAQLTTDAQRQKFDQNVVEMREKKAKREEEMRSRRGMGGGMGGGMRPPR
jgi:nicotinamidase-related amidase